MWTMRPDITWRGYALIGFVGSLAYFVVVRELTRAVALGLVAKAS